MVNMSNTKHAARLVIEKKAAQEEIDVSQCQLLVNQRIKRHHNQEEAPKEKLSKKQWLLRAV